MATTSTLTVRLDDEVAAMLDDLVAFYGKQAADLGLSFGRSDAIRVILRAAHRDMQDKLGGER
jgi:Arc/MetJ-type ribon-helix-helix transcriptional regulator